VEGEGGGRAWEGRRKGNELTWHGVDINFRENECVVTIRNGLPKKVPAQGRQTRIEEEGIVAPFVDSRPLGIISLQLEEVC
jgi:hypothetical protein